MASKVWQGWSFPRTFFIYDHEIVKREEDDPKMAVVFFDSQLQTVSEDVQSLFSGQVMAMVSFLDNLVSSKPRLYCLKKMKIATVHEGRFTMGMASSFNTPDDLATQKLHNLQGFFKFFQGSLHRIFQEYSDDHAAFGRHISKLMPSYLSVARPSKVYETFQNIPMMVLPKKSHLTYLKASHLLQWLKRRPKLLGGCIIYKQRVLCTQLTTALTRYLLSATSTKLLAGLGGISVSPAFPLPDGVQILAVFLTEEEYLMYSKDGRLPRKAKSATDVKMEEVQKGGPNSKGHKTSMDSLLDGSEARISQTREAISREKETSRNPNDGPVTLETSDVKGKEHFGENYRTVAEGKVGQSLGMMSDPVSRVDASVEPGTGLSVHKGKVEDHELPNGIKPFRGCDDSGTEVDHLMRRLDFAPEDISGNFKSLEVIECNPDGGDWRLGKDESSTRRSGSECASPQTPQDEMSHVSGGGDGNFHRNGLLMRTEPENSELASGVVGGGDGAVVRLEDKFGDSAGSEKRINFPDENRPHHPSLTVIVDERGDCHEILKNGDVRGLVDNEHRNMTDRESEMPESQMGEIESMNQDGFSNHCESTEPSMQSMDECVNSGYGSEDNQKTSDYNKESKSFVPSRVTTSHDQVRTGQTSVRGQVRDITSANDNIGGEMSLADISRDAIHQRMVRDKSVVNTSNSGSRDFSQGELPRFSESSWPVTSRDTSLLEDGRDQCQSGAEDSDGVFTAVGARGSSGAPMRSVDDFPVTEVPGMVEVSLFIHIHSGDLAVIFLGERSLQTEQREIKNIAHTVQSQSTDLEEALRQADKRNMKDSSPATRNCMHFNTFDHSLTIETSRQLDDDPSFFSAARFLHNEFNKDEDLRRVHLSTGLRTVVADQRTGSQEFHYMPSSDAGLTLVNRPAASKTPQHKVRGPLGW